MWVQLKIHVFEILSSEDCKQYIKIFSFDMNLRVLKLFCWINWPINSFCTMSFCLIFRLPSQILAFIRGLPDFFVFCFNRLPSVSINFYLSFCEKNLVLPCPSLFFTAVLFSCTPSLKLSIGEDFQYYIAKGSHQKRVSIKKSS